jgi:hypothetical protein
MASLGPKEMGGRVPASKIVWCYSRGTIQYDIICALILAFIFFVPPSCFVKKAGAPQALNQGAVAPQPNSSALDKK